ncbi:ABC transporter substrate-binding protein [Brucella tritici]|uniref:ABC transporter substrate-binding protein n=1 Tax=Brucella tritici TaxID=94626 RepID=A0A6L3YVG2_9HYPH|nr:ABC transporter substrate-binding protein [Brucella tritici]KAB2667491.1 ABC transporter substrate-binding protein [Brucella tritici]KAB2688399.1 ABC transporter substrate-binding protein [Brucella tritici]MBJ6719107.1 ABC transporter substrate-binding protein [Bacillus sp. PR5]
MRAIRIAALCAVMTSVSATAMARDLTIAGWGGNYQDAQREAYFKSIAEKLDVNIVETTYLGGLAEIKAMVDTGNVTWDFLIMGGSELQLACDEGLLEELDWKAIGESNLLPGAATPCGVGNVVIGNGYAYNSKAFPQPPLDWKDFFDREKFPGKRGIRNSPSMNLEYALMADGVAPDKVYEVLATPEGVDRAFAQFDKIKDLLQFWESGAQPIEWLASNNVAMSTGYNGRAVMAKREGKPIEFVWKNHLVNMDGWAMVKGSPYKDKINDIFKIVNDPQNQAKFSSLMPYGPSNTKAAESLTPEMLKELPAADNIKDAAFYSDTFWVEHLDDLTERWTRWATQ